MSPRGFAALTVEQRQAVAAKGGRAARDMGVAHRWTPEEARDAGRKSRTRVRRQAGDAEVERPDPDTMPRPEGASAELED